MFLRAIIYTLSFAIVFFFFNDTATTEIYTLSLHDALPILRKDQIDAAGVDVERFGAAALPDLLERHGGALEVPSGPTTPERRVPGRAHLLVRRLGLLPQRKIARVVLRVLIARDPRADLELSRVES